MISPTRKGGFSWKEPTLVVDKCGFFSSGAEGRGRDAALCLATLRRCLGCPPAHLLAKKQSPTDCFFTLAALSGFDSPRPKQKTPRRVFFLLAKDCDFNKKGIIVKFRNASTQCLNLKALYFLFNRWCFINDSYFPVFYKKDNPYFVISHGAGLTKHNHKWGTSLESFHLQNGTHPTALCLGISFLAHW